MEEVKNGNDIATIRTTTNVSHLTPIIEGSMPLVINARHLILVTKRRDPSIVNVSQHTPILHNEFGHFVENVSQKTEGAVECGPLKAGSFVSTIKTWDLIMQLQSLLGVDVEVGQISFCKNDVKMRLSMLPIEKNFELQVNKWNKNLYGVQCIHETKWVVRAIRMEGCDIFKITKYTILHTCSIEVLDHDHKQISAFVIW